MNKLTSKLTQNIKLIINSYEGASDLVLRKVVPKALIKRECVLIYFDGLSDKTMLSENVIAPLCENTGAVDELYLTLNKIAQRISFSQIEYCQSLPDIFSAINSGDAVLLVQGADKAIVLRCKKPPKRGVSEPQSKTVIRGAHDGFTENYRDNTALLRDRLKTNLLVIAPNTIGQYTKTSVSLCYIKGTADERVVGNIKRKLKLIKLKSALESGFIQNKLEKGTKSFFPLCEATERVDEAAIALLSGRCVIIIENTPFVLIVPGLIKSMLTSSEDYNESTLKRKVFIALRVCALILTLLLPAVYVAVVQFNPEFVSVKMISFIIYARKITPFSEFAEVLFVELIFEAIIEAGIRLPKQIGPTVSIMGTIAIGQGLVEASLVNMVVVILVAFTAVLVFVIPNYSLAISVRILKFVFIFAAAAMGFYGIIAVSILTLINICSLEPFGMEYLCSVVDTDIKLKNVKEER